MRLAGLCLLLFPAALAAQRTAPAPSTAMKRLWTLDATYTDAAHGVSFRYSSMWKPGTQWGYHPPALSYDADHPPAAGFGYEAGGFPDRADHALYSHSNLEGFGVVYQVQSTPDADACRKLASSLTDSEDQTQKDEPETIGGVSYWVFAYGSVGMSQSTEGPLYATWRNGNCYLFETAVSVSGGAYYSDPKAWPKVDTAAILDHLDKVIRTVRFTPQGPVNPPPLATYSDRQSGVAFDYPAVWKQVSSTKSDPYFDYCSPAAFGPGVKDGLPVRFAVQFTGDHNVYASTELASLVFIYGIQPNVSSQACREIASGISDTKPDIVTIHGVSFTHNEGGECGLGHGVDSSVYTTYRNNACYVFEEDFYTAHPDNARALTKPEILALQRHLDAIMQTVRFTPGSGPSAASSSPHP